MRERLRRALWPVRVIAVSLFIAVLGGGMLFVAEVRRRWSRFEARR